MNAKIIRGTMLSMAIGGAMLLAATPKMYAQEQTTTTSESTTVRTEGGVPPGPPMAMAAPDPGYADNGWGMDNMAARHGYNDGFDKGLGDKQAGHSYRPQNVHLYNHPTGYQGGPMSKSEYDRIYKEAFLKGYERGFRRGA